MPPLKSGKPYGTKTISKRILSQSKGLDPGFPATVLNRIIQMGKLENTYECSHSNTSIFM